MKTYKPMLCKPLMQEKADFESLEKRAYWAENKIDGLRCIAYVKDNGQVTLQGRQKELTSQFPKIVSQLKTLCPCVLDGEIAYFDKEGKAVFSEVMKKENEGNLTFAVFDVLEIKGFQHYLQPYEKRKQVLEAFLQSMRALSFDNLHNIQLVPYYKKLETIWKDHTCTEGIIAKRRIEPYYAGQRIDAWIKIKKFQKCWLYALRFEQADHDEVLVCDKGVTVAVPNESDRQQLKQLLTGNKKPIVEISYFERTKDNNLRMPIFKKIVESDRL